MILMLKLRRMCSSANTPSQPPPSQGEEQIEILLNIAAPSQPPPLQGEEQIEFMSGITNRFPPLPRGGLGWGLSKEPYSKMLPCVDSVAR
mgnify:CR=1 FL=1